MIRRALLAAMALAIQSVAHAADEIVLWVDISSYETYLQNTTAGPYSFSGYRITSSNGGLSPAGWLSITDQVANDPTNVAAKLGPGALLFSEIEASNDELTEFNSAGFITLPPGGNFAVGRPWQRWADWERAEAWFRSPTGEFHQTEVTFALPEPSTFLLAVLAGIGLLAFRCRGTRGLVG